MINGGHYLRRYGDRGLAVNFKGVDFGRGAVIAYLQSEHTACLMRGHRSDDCMLNRLQYYEHVIFYIYALRRYLEHLHDERQPIALDLRVRRLSLVNFHAEVRPEFGPSHENGLQLTCASLARRVELTRELCPKIVELVRVFVRHDLGVNCVGYALPSHSARYLCNDQFPKSFEFVVLEGARALAQTALVTCVQQDRIYNDAYRAQFEAIGANAGAPSASAARVPKRAKSAARSSTASKRAHSNVVVARPDSSITSNPNGASPPVLPAAAIATAPVVLAPPDLVNAAAIIGAAAHTPDSDRSGELVVDLSHIDNELTPESDSDAEPPQGESAVPGLLALARPVPASTADACVPTASTPIHESSPDVATFFPPSVPAVSVAMQVERMYTALTLMRGLSNGYNFLETPVNMSARAAEEPIARALASPLESFE